VVNHEVSVCFDGIHLAAALRASWTTRCLFP
jgi:hypothetical protein